jgi:hypothetical protein
VLIFFCDFFLHSNLNEEVCKEACARLGAGLQALLRSRAMGISVL